MRFILLFTFFLMALFSLHIQAQQFGFSPLNVSVEQDGGLLPNAWSGGHNSGQFWPMDLNGDQISDLLLFDKTSGKTHTYLATPQGNGTYTWVYRPDFEDLIPPVRSWIATADFNCDGLEDLFTQTALGIKVYRNVSAIPGQVAFTLEVDGLLSQGFGGMVNIQVNPYGAPAITDVDGDGDLDVLTFDFSGNTVEYHRNLIFENSGNCNGFQLKKDSCVFGRFATKPQCGQIRLNTGCEGQRPGTSPIDPAARVQHIGSQLSAIDLDADGDKDLLVGDIGCALLNRLVNGGTPSQALITASDTLFPSASSYIRLPNFPSAYAMDVNFDGRSDLIVTPTYFSNYSENFEINSRLSTHLYLNQSSGPAPEFEFIEKDFLQNQSIDLGEQAIAAFADVDADGDADMVVGNVGMRNGALLQSRALFFRNIGSPTTPFFRLESSDYLGLSSLFRRRLRPIFEDFNGDGAVDFGWISSPGSTNDSTHLFYLLNQNSAGMAFSFPALSQMRKLPFNFNIYDCPAFFDLNGDGKKDLLIGKYNGRLQYWRQTGSWPNLEYVLENGNLGNIARAPFANNPNLAIADIDQNGSPDLCIGDFTGQIKIYSNFANQTGNWQADSLWYQNLLLNQRVSHFLGNFVAPALADLNGDGYPELAVGGEGGGLNLMVNRLGPNSVNEKNEPQKLISIFPNPVRSGGLLRVIGPPLNFWKVTDALGRYVGEGRIRDGNIQLPNLKGGIYQLQVSGEMHVQTLRLVVED